MRISDWSSDVCSSDLGGAALAGPREVEEVACQRGPACGIVQRQFVSRQAVVEGVGEGDRVVLATLASVFADRLEDGVQQDEIGTVGLAVLAGGSGLARGRARRGGFALRTHGMRVRRSEEQTSELQSLMRISYAVFCLK